MFKCPDIFQGGSNGLTSLPNVFSPFVPMNTRPMPHPVAYSAISAILAGALVGKVADIGLAGML